MSGSRKRAYFLVNKEGQKYRNAHRKRATILRTIALSRCISAAYRRRAFSPFGLTRRPLEFAVLVVVQRFLNEPLKINCFYLCPRLSALLFLELQKKWSVYRGILLWGNLMPVPLYLNGRSHYQGKSMLQRRRALYTWNKVRNSTEAGEVCFVFDLGIWIVLTRLFLTH